MLADAAPTDVRVRVRDRTTVPGRQQKKAARVAELVPAPVTLRQASDDARMRLLGLAWLHAYGCRECACCEQMMPPGEECGWADEDGAYYCKFCWHDSTGKWTPRDTSAE
jgi:hypothetical protein